MEKMPKRRSVEVVTRLLAQGPATYSQIVAETGVGRTTVELVIRFLRLSQDPLAANLILLDGGRKFGTVAKPAKQKFSVEATRIVESSLKHRTILEDAWR